MSLASLGIGAIVETVGSTIDALHTSDEERLKAEIEAYQAETERMEGQTRINETEAQHRSIFVAGWRPAIGWIGAAAMAYQFIAYPMLVWGWHTMQAAGWVSLGLAPPPMLDTEALWVILTGILGLGAARTAEKIKQVTR